MPPRFPALVFISKENEVAARAFLTVQLLLAVALEAPEGASEAPQAEDPFVATYIQRQRSLITQAIGELAGAKVVIQEPLE